MKDENQLAKLRAAESRLERQLDCNRAGLKRLTCEITKKAEALSDFKKAIARLTLENFRS